MYAAHTSSRATEPRRGLILMIVLLLITAFAIVGLSFVLYADSEAKAAQIAREAEQGLVVHPYDLEPKAAFSNFLGQLIFDADDDALANSSLRGHSLARSMYGYNYTVDGNGNKVSTNNTTPFNGVGRLHNTLALAALGNPDEYNMVNYKQFTADGFTRDPERPGIRTGTTKATWLCGFNAPYTYPDLNNMFLAVVDSSGNVLQPSYHRQAIFGSLYNNASPTGNPYDNPNWGLVSPNAVGKYYTLRPRPVDNNGFPYPDDPGGDVKNLIGNPGGNDSIWTDIGSPVRTAPNGKLIRPSTLRSSSNSIAGSIWWRTATFWVARPMVQFTFPIRAGALDSEYGSSVEGLYRRIDTGSQHGMGQYLNGLHVGTDHHRSLWGR